MSSTVQLGDDELVFDQKTAIQSNTGTGDVALHSGYLYRYLQGSAQEQDKRNTYGSAYGPGTWTNNAESGTVPVAQRSLPRSVVCSLDDSAALSRLQMSFSYCNARLRDKGKNCD